MCERMERKPELAEHRGHSLQVGKSKPMEGF